MELKILEKKENKLIDRIEISARLSFTGATPSMEQVKDSIASQMKAKADNILVKKIDTDYGYPSADVTAFIYGSAESMERFESRLGKKALEKIDKKQKSAEEAKKKAEEEAKKAKEEEAAKPKEDKADEKPEEKPAEAPKEDAKPEDKKAEEKPAEAPKEEEKK